jgi:predicted RND superfamily exporter protein
MAQCDEAFGGAHSAYVVVQWPQTLGIRSLEVWQVTSAVHEVLDRESLATGSYSLLNVLRSVPGSSLQSRMSELRRVPAKWRRRLVRTDRQKLVVGTHIPNVGSSEIQAALSRVSRDLEELQAKHPEFQFWMTGTSVVASGNVRGLVGDLGKSLGLAAVMVFAIVAVAFRSLRLGLVSIVPNAFPLLLTASLLVWTGNALRVASVVSFGICLGLAVDDTIHLLMRFSRERHHGSDVRLAIVQSVSSVGIAVVITTIILGAGFAAMMFSDLPVIRELAWFCVLAILFALIGDLLLLPPLLYRCAPATEQSSDSSESHSP